MNSEYQTPSRPSCIGDGQGRLSQCASRQTSCKGNEETTDTRVVDQARYQMIRWHVKR